MTDIFLFAVPIIAVALVVVLFLKEIPLRTRQVAAAPVGAEETADEEISADLVASASH